MKKIYTLLLVLSCFTSYSQSKDDRTIIISVSDSASARSAILRSLMKNELLIKDVESRDTIITYAADIGKTYVVVVASISGSVIQLTGYYNHKKFDYPGSKNYIAIRYYSASKTWPVLQRIANDTGGSITYGK